MQINGQLIKKKRKQLNMTQNQLAKGICKQATISNIEKKNTANNMQIITAICNRLGLEVNDITVTVHKSQVQGLLKKVTKLIRYYKYEEAEILLKDVVEVMDELEEHQLQEAYHCIGALSLFRNGKDDVTLYNLYQSLEHATNEGSIITILSNNLLGIYYATKGFTKQADSFFEKSIRLAELSRGYDREEALSTVYYNIAKYYSSKNEYQKAIDYCDVGISICTENMSLLGLVHLAYERAFNCRALNEEVGREAYKFAEQLAELTKNTEMLAIIRADLKKS